MGSAIAIGPLMLAADRGLAVLCIALFLGLTTLAERYGAMRASSVATGAVIVGLVTARIGYVGAHWSIYAEEPPSILAFWQGGFSAIAGIIGAAVVLVVRLGRSRALIGAGAALATSVSLWFTLTALIPAVTYGPFPYGVALSTPAGKPVALEGLRGRPFVVNLWATWCGPCRRELPMLARAAAREGAVPILLVDQGEAPEIVAAFLVRERVDPRYVALDPDRKLSRAFETAGYPATAFVAADGTIVQHQLGELSRAALEDGIDMARKHR